MPIAKKGTVDGTKKKGKGTKKGRRKDTSLIEDVPTTTSLPPKVDGQLRCHLRVSTTQILWNVSNAPDFTQVRLLWWGEEGKGALFRPVDVKRGEKRGPMHYTTARYPVRAGPKQLASYFNDMGSMNLDVLSGPHQVVVGRTQIDRITSLTPNTPINGFYPVFSADQEKVAELQVCIVLESLMASFDSTCSMPTPDMSLQMRESFNEAQPVNPPRIVPTPAPQPVYSLTDDPFRSPTANKFQSRIDHDVPKGVDHMIYGTAGRSVQDSGQSFPSSAPSDPLSMDDVRRSASSVRHSKDTTGSATYRRNLNPAPMTGAPGPRERNANRPTYATLADITNRGEPSNLLGSGGSGGRDLVTELLERGQKLREAMIVSTLDTGAPTHDTHITDHIQSGLRPSGKFLNDMLLDMDHPDKLRSARPNAGATDAAGRFAIGRGFGSVGVGVRGGGFDTLSMSSDMEDKAIDLILGPDGDDEQYKLMKDFGGSPTGSLSGGDDILSDPGDPIYDDVLLQELFYRNTEAEESDISLSECEPDTKPSKEAERCDSATESLNEPGNMRPPSRSGSRRSSTSSILLDLEPTRDTEPANSPPASRKKRKKKRKSQREKDTSDTDQLNSSRASESSRVSFDPAPSDADEPSTDTSRSTKKGMDGLSVERLTLLGRVHVARVMIDSLSLSFSLQATPTKTTARSRSGKPPRPVKKLCTYFVEYQFPVVATSRDKYSPNTMATEVMRVASKKVSDGLVTFSHRSVFPVLFDGEAVDKWWRSALVFKVYSRAPAQKVPTLLGMCSVPLKSVLKSEALYLERSLEVKDRSGSTSGSSSSSLNRSKHGGTTTVGFIKLVVELASDSKDFAKALARTRLAEMTNPRIVALPQTPSSGPTHETRERRHSGGVPTTAGTQTEPRSLNLDTAPLAPPTGPARAPHTVHTAPPGTTTRQHQHHHTTPLDACTNTMDKEEAITLHALVLIPEGENVTLQGVRLPRHGDREPSAPPQPMTGWTGRDTSTRNLYLSVRMFWCDDTARSDVCWGTIDPVFKFSQVVPVLLTTSFLERLRNNFVVVEVWDKKTSSDNDQLVGMVKLPLHQFYMSYRDRRIAASLYKSQYPVVSIDTDMPIVSPFTGATHGRLKVLLAMGSAQQVCALQSLKADSGSAVMVPERPLHYLERQHLVGGSVPGQEYSAENIVDHTFEVSVEGVRGLRLLETMIWGEADCFVQYHFPSQTLTHPNTGPAVVHAGLSLKTFRTATTLCIPDPVFNDVLQHKVCMPEGTPVQREILTACAGAGGGSGGVPLEVWCRYYYPNTRDQVIAKAVLPLAKLCAMVTMKRQGEPNVQTFSLPLCPVGADPEDGTPPGDSPGLLDITITYRTHTRQGESKTSHEAVSRSLPGAQVCISASILRASALKAAVARAAGEDAGLQYAAEVGCNAYVRVNMSFLQKQDERITRTVARSFAPEFSYHMDFPVPLLWTELDCDALSLAEILDSAEVTFEIWHETPSAKYDVDDMQMTPTGEVTGRRVLSRSGDVLIGTTTIPLIGLLKQASGIKGWFGVNAPTQTWDTPDTPHTPATTEPHGQAGLSRVAGGLEVALRFAHQEDRDRVLHAGRSVGWAPGYEVEARDWEDADDMSGRFSEVVVSVDVACCPLASALLAGQARLDPNAGIYVRYKFYDRNAVCSKMAGVSVTDDEDYVNCDLHHAKTLVVPSSGPFLWYLNEERLEVQVWLNPSGHTTSSSPSSSRPRNRDKLIGAAYLQLDALADQRRRQHRISGVYPLFKPGSANLGGACIRAHVTMRPHSSGAMSQSEESEVEEMKSPQRKSPSKVSPKAASPVIDYENTFSAYVSIERALHLPYIVLGDRKCRGAPSCYVSYQSAERETPVCTDVVREDASPTWSYNQQTRLHKELLTDDAKNLVFKVWHKPDGGRVEPDKTTDRVLGFVSVDLCPLAACLSQIRGWYNIMDFNGICQGQIKIAVTPHEAVTEATNPAHRMDSHCSLVSLPHIPGHVTSSTNHLDAESRGVLTRFSQHYENVKHYHESLASHLGTRSDLSAVHHVPEVSRSALYRSLRSNMADLDNITCNLKSRLHGGQGSHPERAPEPREPLNHTGHSTQTETETSALTNSQQFLPLPNEVATSGTDGEPRTLERTKGSALSTAYDSLRSTDLFDLPTGTSTMLSGAVKDAVGGMLHGGEEFQDSANSANSEQLHDSILARGPALENGDRPFRSYHPLSHHSSDEEEAWRGIAEQDENIDGPEGSGQDYNYNTDDDVGGEVIVPRALNDISNANFNNMMSHLSGQDYTSRIIEDDSWFTATSPRRGSHLQCTIETVTDEANLPSTDPDQSVNHNYPPSTDPDQSVHHNYTGPLTDTAGTLRGTVTTLGGTVTTLGATVTSFGGTATSMGSVAPDDPYGRTLVGGQLNKLTKLNMNYDDSWATNNASVNAEDVDAGSAQEEEEAVREKVLEEPIGGGGRWSSRPAEPPKSDPEEDAGLEMSVLSPEEKSLIMEEDPLSFSSVSRTTLSESNSHKVNQARKAAMYRREYERHRNEHSSSSEHDDQSSDSDAGSRVSSRRRRPRSRSSPTKRPEVEAKSPGLEPKPGPSNGYQGQIAPVETQGDMNTEHRSTEDYTLEEESPRSECHSEKSPPLSYVVTPRSEDPGSEHREAETSVGEGSDAVSRHNASKSSTNSVPNFFLPSSDLEHSMRALRTANLDKSGVSSVADQSGGSARSLLSGRFSGTSSAKTKPLPDPQHTQRLAKIFSSKFAS